MKITEIGKYRLLKDFTVRSSISVRIFPKGAILNITQIDRSGKKVISNELKDWVSQELPVEIVQ